MTKTFTILIILYLSLSAIGQEYKSHITDDGMKVKFYADTEKNLIHVIIQAKTTHKVSELVNNLNDIEHYTEWVPHSESPRTLEVFGKDSIFYYIQNKPPFPLPKKDAIFKIDFRYKDNGNVTVVNTCKPNRLPLVKGYERVTHHAVIWYFIKEDNETIVRYVLETKYPNNTPIILLEQFVKLGAEKSVRNFLKKLD